ILRSPTTTPFPYTTLFRSALLTTLVQGQSYPVSDHYNGKTFYNPGQDDLKSFWQVLKWQLIGDKAVWPTDIPNKNYPFRPLASEDRKSTRLNSSHVKISYA